MLPLSGGEIQTLPKMGRRTLGRQDVTPMRVIYTRVNHQSRKSLRCSYKCVPMGENPRRTTKEASCDRSYGTDVVGARLPLLWVRTGKSAYPPEPMSAAGMSEEVSVLPDLPGKHIFPGKLYDYPGKYHYPRKNQKGCPTTLSESYFYPRKARTC